MHRLLRAAQKHPSSIIPRTALFPAPPMPQSSIHNNHHTHPSSRIRLLLDFDGTLTQTDTLSHLASAAYATHDPATRARLKPWSHFGEAYAHDYEAHAARYTPPPDDRTTVAQEAAWLESLRPVEEASLARVLREGVFARADEGDISVLARRAVDDGRVVFRAGWAGFVADVVEGMGAVSVVSVNWSRCWVRACMERGLEGFAERNGRALGSEGQVRFEVYANEVCGVGSDTSGSGSRGEMKLQTSSDKLRYVRQRDQVATALENGVDQSVAIYVGDSPTDLESILAADVGICMQDSPMRSGQKELSEACARLGIEVSDLGSFAAADAQAVMESATTSSRNTRRRIWWSRDFDDIHNWLRRWRPRLQSN